MCESCGVRRAERRLLLDDMYFWVCCDCAEGVEEDQLPNLAQEAVILPFRRRILTGQPA